MGLKVRSPAMANAVTAKYASVFPPPVGNQSKSTTLFVSNESSLIVEYIFKRINAN
jgi:hypothetical protein